MDIRDIHASGIRHDKLRNEALEEAQERRPAAVGDPGEQPIAEAGDRVEISDTARAALADARASGEIDFARKALHDVPGLDAERAQEIMRRVQDGYYAQPEVLTKIAEKFAAGLTG